MSFVRRNINAVLLTILIHLVIVFVCLFSKISVLQQTDGEYIIIDPEAFEQKEEVDEQTEMSENQMTDEQIDQFLQSLGITGSNSTAQAKTPKSQSSSSMSPEEMKAKYEEQFLREKYGDDYENAINRTAEDYIDPSRMQEVQKTVPQANVVKSGPALVYAELNNKERQATYLNVPVFTCQGSGVVVVAISINSSGKVVSAEIVSENLTVDADCLKNAARNAALKSTFSKMSGNKTEGGKITYTFVKQ
ncbi:MAG: hypothetical protein HUK15_03430 [Bacteroidales bacterium]|nr:hypothetical protein [Bacteroidales bacterium]